MALWFLLLAIWLAVVCPILWDLRNREGRTPFEPSQKAVSPDFAALIETIQIEGRADRGEEAKEDRGKRFRDYLTLFFVIATTAGVFYQAHIFSDQLAEMHTGGEQTGRLIESNAQLAIAAAKQANSAEKQAIAMSDYAQATRDNIKAAQRAWVGPRNLKSDKAPVLNQPLNVILEYQNTGRDPATDAVKDIDVFTGTDADDKSGLIPNKINDFISSCKIMWKPLSANVVYPSGGWLGTPYELTKVVDGQLIDEEIVAGTKNIYATGCIVYKTFESIHRSWFCFFYKNGKVKPENWAICEIGNGAD
jgi:hypothetical protein